MAFLYGLFVLSFAVAPYGACGASACVAADGAKTYVAGERIIFDWHNFLSSCSTWDAEDWHGWIERAHADGYNAIMVHAYGNNPMAAFSFNGKERSVGRLSTSADGRDWSTMHVNDVRRLVGGEVFDSAVFGSRAAAVPDGERVSAARSLMKQVFADAASRGMGVYFAVDLDTANVSPRELITMLPERARLPLRNCCCRATKRTATAISSSTFSPRCRPRGRNTDRSEGFAHAAAGKLTASGATESRSRWNFALAHTPVRDRSCDSRAALSRFEL